MAQTAGIHYKWNREMSEMQPFYLPFGKADNTASPVLCRVRGKVLQLHPARLRSEASSTIATLGLGSAISWLIRWSHNSSLALCPIMLTDHFFEP